MSTLTNRESGAFLVWLGLIIAVALLTDGGWILGSVMALAGVLLAVLAVRARRKRGRPRPV
ncbi:MAG: hypothetical protein ACR2K2_07800 [Mycobacteriales bacterium]